MDKLIDVLNQILYRKKLAQYMNKYCDLMVLEAGIKNFEWYFWEGRNV